MHVSTLLCMLDIFFIYIKYFEKANMFNVLYREKYPISSKAQVK